jgi:nitrogen fixation protein FixH
MKMHWGYGIWGGYAAFVLGMLFLVYQSTQNFAGLVAKDYYKLDLEYQNRAEAVQRTRQLVQQPILKLDSTPNTLLLQMPAGHSAASGKLKLYRPSNAKADQTLDVQGSTTSYQVKHLEKGLYRAELSWQSDGLNYYFEQPLYVQL